MANDLDVHIERLTKQLTEACSDAGTVPGNYLEQFYCCIDVLTVTPESARHKVNILHIDDCGDFVYEVP